MNVITKLALDRRTMLRGLGTAFALPLLDAMVPALTAFQNTAAKPACRFGAAYVPNGMIMRDWTPKVEGAAYEFTPILKSMEPFRDKMLLISGLNSIPPVTQDGQDGGPHSRASTRFLTDVPPTFTTGGSGLGAGTSVDQILAKSIGQSTQLSSLELGLETTDSAGACDPGFSCAYTSTIAWRSPTTPLPTEYNPRAVFERMFGDGGNTDRAASLTRIHDERSILDSVTQKVGKLQGKLGAGDRTKLVEYVDAIRDVERRIQMAEAQNSKEVTPMDHPAGVPGKFADHARLMYDLWFMAYQADMTRVVTFMFGREFSGRTYPEIGVPDSHHPATHTPALYPKVALINAYHLSFFAEFVKKLQSTPDGDGTLLDHSILVYGAGMSDPFGHNPRNLPIMLVGGGYGELKGGRHIRVAKETPLANLHLTVMDKLGVRMDKIGDSKGELDLVSGV